MKGTVVKLDKNSLSPRGLGVELGGEIFPVKKVVRTDTGSFRQCLGLEEGTLVSSVLRPEITVPFITSRDGGAEVFLPSKNSRERK